MRMQARPCPTATAPRRWLASVALGMASASLAFPAAGNEPPRAARGLTEISDGELGHMRGRYAIGHNAVAWFGVRMVSTWQTPAGQTVQGSLQVGMDFTKATGGQPPKVSFTPLVSITAIHAPGAPGASDGLARSINSAGLANVSGMVQSVQVAGDGNRASNTTQLTIHDGVPGTGAHDSGSSTGAHARAGTAQATASFDGAAARVLLQIEDQGVVEQWIRSGSLGQSIQLTSDNQLVSNRLEIELVRQGLAANTQLVQNVAQALQMTRTIRPGI